jgi:hypothetical protein
LPMKHYWLILFQRPGKKQEANGFLGRTPS